MERYIGESLASGFIWVFFICFFFLLLPCIDYWVLNDITVENKYPLPLIDSLFAPLQKACLFTKFNLRNAYHLVRIREGHEWKTAFNTPLGHFDYLVMPFGLTNATAVFQALVNATCSIGLFLFIVMTFSFVSEMLEAHKQHVHLVHRSLMENQLFKAEKCEFLASSVTFLCFVVQQGQLAPDPAKVRFHLCSHSLPPRS